MPRTVLNVLAAALAGSTIASALVPVTPPRLSPRIASRSPMGPRVEQEATAMTMSASSMGRRAAINRAIGGGGAAAVAAAVLGGAPQPSLAAGYKMVEDEGLLRYLCEYE